jgi:hypothetical protein
MFGITAAGAGHVDIARVLHLCGNWTMRQGIECSIRVQTQPFVVKMIFN